MPLCPRGMNCAVRRAETPHADHDKGNEEVAFSRSRPWRPRRPTLGCCVVGSRRRGARDDVVPASPVAPEETEAASLTDDTVLAERMLGPAPAIVLSLDEAIDRVILALGPGPRPERAIAERSAIADSLVAARRLLEQSDETASTRRSA